MARILNEGQFHEIISRLERFVNISNEKNLILEKHLSKLEFKPTIVNVEIPTKDIAIAIKLLAISVSFSATLICAVWLSK